jgi:hypothetical protein
MSPMLIFLCCSFSYIKFIFSSFVILLLSFHLCIKKCSDFSFSRRLRCRSRRIFATTTKKRKKTRTFNQIFSNAFLKCYIFKFFFRASSTCSQSLLEIREQRNFAMPENGCFFGELTDFWPGLYGFESDQILWGKGHIAYNLLS